MATNENGVQQVSTWSISVEEPNKVCSVSDPLPVCPVGAYCIKGKCRRPPFAGSCATATLIRVADPWPRDVVLQIKQSGPDMSQEFFVVNCVPGTVQMNPLFSTCWGGVRGNQPPTWAQLGINMATILPAGGAGTFNPFDAFAYVRWSGLLSDVKAGDHEVPSCLPDP